MLLRSSDLSWRRLDRRLAVGDPGLARLRLAVAATVSMGVVLVVEYVYAHFTMTADTQAAMILGSVSAMQISGAVMQPHWQQRLRVAAWQPVVVGTGLTVSILALEFGGKPWQLAMFIPVTFVSVAIRWYGPQFITLGLMAWVGYFIAVFLSPALTAIPFLLGAEVLSAATVFALSLAVWSHRPLPALRHAFDAWSAQADFMLGNAAQVVVAGNSLPRRQRLSGRLTAQAVELTDTALLVEGWLGQSSPNSADWHPAAARGQLLQAHLAIDSIVEAVKTMTIELIDGHDPARQYAAQILEDLSAGSDTKAEQLSRDVLAESRSARALTGSAGDRSMLSPVTVLAEAALALVSARRSWNRPPPGPNGISSFTPAVTLVPGGSLAGVAGAVSQILPRGHRIFHRISLPMRQAIQVTVAMGIALPLAYAISSVHYQWALVAVFIVFLGTSTRGETAVKATHRVMGTVAGLIVAMPVAALTDGNALGVIAVALVCCFAGHYLMTISYSFMMFFITVAVLQLYEMMHEFTGQLLFLRFAETVVGAAIALLVASVVAPISTRDTAKYIQLSLFSAVADLLAGTADQLEAGTSIDTDEMSRVIRSIEDAARRHRIAGNRPMWRTRDRENRQAANAAYAALAMQVRHTAAWIDTDSSVSTMETARRFRGLAEQADALAHDRPMGALPWAAVTDTEQIDPDRGDRKHPLTRLHHRLYAVDQHT